MNQIEIENITLLRKLMSPEILILDGGMATMLQKMILSENDFRGEFFKQHTKSLANNYDVLTISQPEIIKSIHLEYLKAGADIISTCTFNSNRISQAAYNTEKLIYQLNKSAAKIAKSVCKEFDSPDKLQRFVAGVVGPINKIIDPSDYNLFSDAYYEQISGLCDGGANLLLIETVINLISCKAAVLAAEKYFDTNGYSLPIFVSATIDVDGKLLDGSSLIEYYQLVSNLPNVSAIGLNCSYGAYNLTKNIGKLSEISKLPILLYPNAGLPNEIGEYEESADEFAQYAMNTIDQGFAKIVGGCCGTTPEYIKIIRNKINKSIDTIHKRN